MVDKLVTRSFNDELVAQNPAFDNRCWCSGGHDRVVVLAGYRLIPTLLDHDARWDDVVALARRVRHQLHWLTAQRTDALLGGQPVVHWNTFEVSGEITATTTALGLLALALLLCRRSCLVSVTRLRGLRKQRQQQLCLQTLESLRPGPRTRQVRQTFH